MGRRQTTGGVSPAGDRIAVRFTWRGQDIRPTLDLKPTAANLAHAKRLRASIVREIEGGTFKMDAYFPAYRFASKHDAGNVEESRTIKDWFDVWALLSARSMEASTLAIYKRHMAAYWLPTFGGKQPRSIKTEALLSHLSALAVERLDPVTGARGKALSRKTQNNIMIPLRGVLELACRALRLVNPCDGIDNLKVQKAQPDPFSAEEVEVILSKALELEGEDVRDWFEFAFFAGMRVGEQIALPWSAVDLRLGTAVVRAAVVMGKAKDRTKTHTERLVELNDRALAVIQRQRAKTQMQPHGRVFATFGQPEKPWHDEQVQWRVWTRILRFTRVRPRPPKECRDTSVTMALQSGASVMYVAQQHGHSVQVMLASYAKWLPNADKGRNREAVNRAIAADIGSPRGDSAGSGPG